jgi:hypothetical protein
MSNDSAINFQFNKIRHCCRIAKPAQACGTYGGFLPCKKVVQRYAKVLLMALNWKPVLVLVVVGIVLGVAMLFFSGTTDIAHESLKYELNAIGQSIYEYHAQTGQWPSSADDLERTSLSLRQRYWRPTLDNGSIVIVWHDELKPNPKDNGGVILAYHNRGLLAEMGRQWVCWGDLRTEYISSKRLKAVLNSEPR